MFRTTALLAAALLAVSACGSGRTSSATPAPADSSAILVVRNERGGQITVEALYGSTRRRIGTVDAGMTSRFTLPREVYRTGSVRFQATGFPGGVVLSQEVTVSDGQRVEFTVSSQLGSSIVVRPQ